MSDPETPQQNPEPPEENKPSFPYDVEMPAMPPDPEATPTHGTEIVEPEEDQKLLMLGEEDENTPDESRAPVPLSEATGPVSSVPNLDAFKTNLVPTVNPDLIVASHGDHVTKEVKDEMLRVDLESSSNPRDISKVIRKMKIKKGIK